MDNASEERQKDFGLGLDPVGCHSLLEDIVYHAVKDLKCLNDSHLAAYVDDDHRSICREFGFNSGMAELQHFFFSPWFLYICDHFEDISAEEIINNIDISCQDKHDL